MRLRNLELQGYKTFASRTKFVFDDGVTAIVGPNGSGKSNIADAIRWVLGEQSYRALRGKRTEDMIFSGSAQRARLGMASASLTLDNEEGWLPIDFAEVTVTRRAYRSGENEYLLNGQRVRLGDIQDLLSKSGLAQRTYTVIGQGLVDSVLSLRPEDRRALFEEAAGISVYRAKRSEALARLDETRANLLRVSDIVQEIAPRLRRLEREAERSSLHRLLQRQLEELLRTLYGYRWHQAQSDLRQAREAVAKQESRLSRCKEGLEALLQELAAVRVQTATVRERLSGWHRESSQLHRQMEQVQRDLAVWQERARLLRGQRDELEAGLAEVQRQAQVLGEQCRSAEEGVRTSEAAYGETLTDVASAQADLEAHERERGELSRRLSEAHARTLDLAGRVAARRSRLVQIDERRVALSREGLEHAEAASGLSLRATTLASQLEACALEEAQLEAEAGKRAADVARLDAALAEAGRRQTELRARLAESELAIRQIQARHDALRRLREEGEGLYAGVRAVLGAAGIAQGLPPARKPREALTDQGRAEAGAAQLGAGVSAPRQPADRAHRLAGIVGTLAQLIEVPAEYEVAIEVALGSHLQDLVVESWANAEEAIAFLRSGNRGRATFLPLDTVRPSARCEVPDEPGVIGLGVDLVGGEPRLARVLEMLLARTLVVRDLAAARRAFNRLHGGFQIVSLVGDLLRSSGAVTGGQGQGSERGHVLAREREWRGLPADLAAAEERRERARSALEDASADERRMNGERELLRAALARHKDVASQAAGRRLGLEREADRIAQESAWHRRLVAQLESEQSTLTETGSRLDAELQRCLAEEEAAARLVAALQVEVEQLRGEALYQRLSDARTAAAVARGVLEHEQRAVRDLQMRRSELEEQERTRRDRLAALRQEQESLSDQISSQISQETVTRGWLEALEHKIREAEGEVRQLESERERRVGEEQELRARLSAAESSHAQAALARSRQEDRRLRLRRQVMEDFGLVEMETIDNVPDQLPLPLADMVRSLPVVEELPAGLEEDVHQLRAQIRRMGTVNPNAPEEYAEVRERHDFLSTQAADLEQASVRLRQVIDELDDVMRQEFQKTFQAVAHRFEANFGRLFGGGTARLSLTDPDELSTTGIEIVARPPGKRLQTLALLSGGERSLTAVALVFALLQINPPPFCILDEVDAMLDEANVQRFRGLLQELARDSQCIVITHNRTTVQAASTIYGVSMGEDSVSQVVSLRLDGDRIVTPHAAEAGPSAS